MENQPIPAIKRIVSRIKIAASGVGNKFLFKILTSKKILKKS